MYVCMYVSSCHHVVILYFSSNTTNLNPAYSFKMYLH